LPTEISGTNIKLAEGSPSTYLEGFKVRQLIIQVGIRDFPTSDAPDADRPDSHLHCEVTRENHRSYLPVFAVDEQVMI
jgi:hypothetical protein